MSDDRWGWTTTPATINPHPSADADQQKQHFTNSAAEGAGHAALDLWSPAPAPAPAEPVRPGERGLAYSAVDTDTGGTDVAVGGPGADAPTAQWPAQAPTPPPQDSTEQIWTDQWYPDPTDDGLDQLVTDGRRRQARRRSLRRAGIVAGFLSAAGAVMIAGVIAILPAHHDPSPAPAPAAGSAPQGWCATGTNGSTTTVAAGGGQTTPDGAVAAFLSGLIDARSAAAARTVMAPTAPAPTLEQLQGWISALPPATNGWCAQVTATDSAARVVVDLRLHAGTTAGRVGHRCTFYVSSSTPAGWVIDAIVSDEGSQS